MPAPMNRRAFLQAIGCSAAAFPLLSHATFASAPFDHRLVVVILRGAMDGLDLLRPAGDPALATLRPDLVAEAGIPLDDFWQLHPALNGLMPLWQAGELGFVHAVSTPYRDKRSHFDGQDLLEAGTAPDSPSEYQREGWLNRMLAGISGARSETAFAIGREALPILEGKAPINRWSPDTEMRISPQARRLLERLYEDDAPFHAAAQTALELTQRMEDMATPLSVVESRKPDAEITAFANFAGARLREDTRIVALSLGGWDTHVSQAAGFVRPLRRLEQLILDLRASLGPTWSKTAFIAMTEFGRTVRQNGTKGTDHGTGGAMITAGGAVKGGKVLGQWPGLSEQALYAGRDLMPTQDVRAVAGWVLHALMGQDKSKIETDIFPGMDLGPNPGLV